MKYVKTFSNPPPPQRFVEIHLELLHADKWTDNPAEANTDILTSFPCKHKEKINIVVHSLIFSAIQ
jgi:hypothetical protein